MWQETIGSLPIIPLSVCLMAPFTLVAAGLVMMLRDAGAFDTGRLHSVGIALVGIGISGWLVIGTWNMTVAMVRLMNHQTAYAIAAPAKSPQE